MVDLLESGRRRGPKGTVISNPLESTKYPRVLTLVPNARRLKMHVADALRGEPDGAVVVAPPVRVFSQWAEELVVRIGLLEGAPVPVLADPVELRALWASFLGPALSLHTATECSLAAIQARSADRMISHWWPVGEPPWLGQAFWAARRQVAAALKGRSHLTPEGWLEALSQQLGETGKLHCSLPQSIHLDGFLEITALEGQVLDALRHKGVDVEIANLCANAPGAVRLTSYPSLEDELSAVAHWARDTLTQADRRIAVVINGLESQLEVVQEAFEDVLYRAHRLELEEIEDCNFHIPGGSVLSSHPVITDALLLLKLATAKARRPLEFPEVSRWLLSPYWRGADSERVARAQFELRLRKRGSFWLSRGSIARLAGEGPSSDLLDRLTGCIGEVELVAASASGSALGNLPGSVFLQLLQAWGWPGPLAHGHDLSHFVTRFCQLLERLNGLEKHSPAKTLELLTQLCNETHVELRGGPLSPIQIMTPEDAVGLTFDAAWVVNVHDGNWPAHPQLNPFLPGESRGVIPRSSPEGALGYCKQLTESLKCMAPSLQFSWARQSGDVRNGVSPVLERLAPVTDRDSMATDWFDQSGVELDRPDVHWGGYLGHPWLQAVDDGIGLPLHGARDGSGPQPIQGGSGMISSQSACPMLAYFKYRLGARMEDMPSPFADAAYRGALMHRAMQFLYSGQVGQPGSPLADQVVRSVEQALEQCRAHYRLMPVSYLAERLRLISLLEEWLEFEQDRPEFVVEHLEERLDSTLFGHPVSLRVDRLDRLADGSLMIVDYKSSKTSTAGWAQERLKHAQLPLYATLMIQERGERVAAIALATVRAGECKMGGIAAEAMAEFDGVRSFGGRKNIFTRHFSVWPQLLNHWTRAIEELAEEIVGGRADNTVYDDTVVQWSGLEILLRHDEGEAWKLEHASVNVQEAGA